MDDKEVLEKIIEELSQFGIQNIDTDERIGWEKGSIINLNLKNLGLHSLPKSIANLENLRSLNLSKNHLTSLPDYIAQMMKLRDVYLIDNEFELFPNELLNLSLRILFMNSNKLQQIPLEFINQKITLGSFEGNSDLGELSANFTSYSFCFSTESASYLTTNEIRTRIILREIKRYLLDGIPLTDLFEKIRNLHKHGVLSNFIDKISDPKQLALIRIDSPELNEYIVPRYEIIKDSNPILEQLEIIAGQKIPHFKILPVDKIGYTTHQQRIITGLSLVGLSLTKLPIRVTEFPGLEYLLLDRNRISELPTTIGEMPSLSALSLRSNSFRNIDTLIQQLFNVKYLNVASNQLVQIDLSLDSNHQLYHFNASGCHLKEFHMNDRARDQVTKLDLSDNPLSKTDLDQFSGSALTRLNLSKTNLHEFPDNLSLPELRYLNLSHNNFTTLPRFDMMPVLQELDIEDNLIETISSDLDSIPAGINIKISGNSLQKDEIEWYTTRFGSKIT